VPRESYSSPIHPAIADLSLASLDSSNSTRFLWYSATHIGAAKQWHDEIGRALAQCDWFLVVLTPDAVRAEWVKRELVFALNEGRYRKRIVPLLHKPCKYSRLSWTLPGFEIVDFTANFESGCRQLLRVWNLEYKPKRMTARPKSKRK
jgi:TIR domain